MGGCRVWLGREVEAHLGLSFIYLFMFNLMFNFNFKN